MINETIQFNLNDIPAHIKLLDNENNGTNIYPIDLNTFINVPIVTFLTKDMENNCIYMSDAIGIVTDMKHEENNIDLNVIISPKFESLWINSKKKLTLEYQLMKDKVIISALILVE